MQPIALGDLFETYGRVEELRFDQEFFDHMGERSTYDKHKVTVIEVLETHSNDPKYFENNVEGGAPVVMVGVTGTTRYICVPLDPTMEVGVWSPRTAFEANAHHRNRYLENNDG